MAKGGIPLSKGFSPFSREWGELLFQANFLAVGISLGHLSMKKIFSYWSMVALKLDKGRVLEW